MVEWTWSNIRVYSGQTTPSAIEVSWLLNTPPPSHIIKTSGRKRQKPEREEENAERESLRLGGTRRGWATLLLSAIVLIGMKYELKQTMKFTI